MIQSVDLIFFGINRRIAIIISALRCCIFWLGLACLAGSLTLASEAKADPSSIKINQVNLENALLSSGADKVFSSKLSGKKELEYNQSNAFGTVRLSALLASGSAEIREGLIWRILSSEMNEDGEFNVVSTSNDPKPSFLLIAADYIISVSYGLATATQSLRITGGEKIDFQVILNAGGLRVTSKLTDGTTIPDDQVKHKIYTLDDFTPEKKLIFSSVQSGKIVRLNVGNYQVVSHYGNSNAIVEANVAIQAGRLSDAEIRHSASRVTFKLLYKPGGEALANTTWTIFASDSSTLVAESTGAFPEYILAAGEYTVIAQHEGQYYRKDFIVKAGSDQDVELVAMPN